MKNILVVFAAERDGAKAKNAVVAFAMEPDFKKRAVLFAVAGDKNDATYAMDVANCACHHTGQMIDLIYALWYGFFDNGVMSPKTFMLLFIGFLFGVWHERMRTKAIIFELSQLLSKHKIKTDITSIDLTE